MIFLCKIPLTIKMLPESGLFLSMFKFALSEDVYKRAQWSINLFQNTHEKQGSVFKENQKHQMCDYRVLICLCLQTFRSKLKCNCEDM